MPDHAPLDVQPPDPELPDAELPGAGPPDDEMAAVSPAALFDFAGWRHRELFIGCTFAWEALTRLPEYLRSALRPGIRGEVEPGAYLVGDVEIADGARVEAGATSGGLR